MELPNDLISVIVPVYNVEKTLARCLDSILSQTGVNLEVIVVDDGSTDSSGDICAAYAEKHDEIMLIRQENGGLSAARNRGLDIARGSYVVFADSDDYVLENMYSTMLSVSKNFDADVCCCGYIKDRGDESSDYPITNEARPVSPLDYLGQMLLGSVAGYVWNRMYRRDLIGSLRFVESPAEDIVFNCKLWNSIQKVAYAPGCYYGYVFRPDSLSNSSYAGIKDGVWVNDEIMADLEKALPARSDVRDLTCARKAQCAFNELLAISGLQKYDWLRPRLLLMIRDNYAAYCKFERSLVKRVAYRVLPALPPALVGALARAAGIQR